MPIKVKPGMNSWGRSIAIPERIFKHFDTYVFENYNSNFKKDNLISAFMYDFVFNKKLDKKYVKRLEELAIRIKKKDLEVDNIIFT